MAGREELRVTPGVLFAYVFDNKCRGFAIYWDEVGVRQHIC